MLQETHSSRQTEARWKNEFGGKIWFSHGQTNARGVAILCKRELQLEVKDIMRDNDGRYIIMRAQINGEKLLIANIYGPNRDTPGIFEEFFTKIDRSGIDRRIVVGDFNTTLDAIDRSVATRHNNVQQARLINDKINELDFTDVWRIIQPDKPGYTWRRVHPYLLSERLDYILLDTSLQQFIKYVNIMPGYKSDHSIVILDLVFELNKRGPGYWKFNNTLLTNKDYVESINKLLDIELGQRNNYSKSSDHWEIMKLGVRNTTLQFAARLQKSKRNKIEILKKKLKFWQKQSDISLTIDKERTLQSLKKELYVLYEERTQGAVMRCRANWQEYAGKPSKYFLNLERARFNKKAIHRLDNGKTITTNPEEIQEHLDSYFKQLYTKKIEVNPAYLDGLTLPQISEIDKSSLEQPVTTVELGRALKQLSSNKAPSTDGLPAEFYKTFWLKLKEWYTDVINEAIEEGRLHLSARRGVISLIEKIGKQILLLDSWRPISLLGADYKIYAKLIANRLQLVLPSIIHESQLGFMKGRNLGENILKMLALMQWCEESRTSAIVISYDFRKAFDCLEWKAIFHTLEALNFGEFFNKMVAVLYKDIYSAVMNNGRWGQWLELGCSTRQGCPASALIFNIVIEMLGIGIRQNIKIQGLEMFSFLMISTQYADDIWVALKPVEDNIDNLTDLLERFYLFSGLQVNYKKTVAFKLGPCRDTDAKYYTQKPINWTNDPVKILGIWFHPNKEIMWQKNFFDKLKKTEATLEVWANRGLNTMGKISIVNSLINSQYIFQLAALPTPPKNFFTSYRVIITKFLWGSKISKVRHAKIIQDYAQGGLKLGDLEAKEQALKAKWPLYFQQRNLPWFYYKYPVRDHRIWEANTRKADIQLMLKPSIQKDIWSAWSKIYYVEPEQFQEIAIQRIWGNSIIRRAGLPIFNAKLLNSGLEYVLDLYENSQGSLYRYEQLEDNVRESIDVMFFNSIKSAIPVFWRKSNINREELQIDSPMKILVELKNPSKYFYWKIIENIAPKSTLHVNWSIDLGIEISEEFIADVFPRTLSITNVTQLRDFQYKITNRILTTNARRSKYAEVSDLCVFCYNAKETVVHLLFECEVSQKMWKLLSKWISYWFQQKVELTAEIVLFNSFKGKNVKVINTIILIMKRYLYIQKCKEERPEFRVFVNYMNRFISVEKYIALRNNKLEIFVRKWNYYLDSM